MSKGSLRRQAGVSDAKFSSNWDAVFKASMGQMVQNKKVEKAEGATFSKAPALSVSTSPGNTDTS